MNTKYFLQSYKSLRLCSLFWHLISHCCSNWINFIYFSSSYLILSSVPSILMLKPSTEFFIVVILIFSSKISIWLFLISSFLLFGGLFICLFLPEAFYIFAESSYFSMFQVYLLLLVKGFFMMTVWQFFSDNSNNSVILMLVFVDCVLPCYKLRWEFWLFLSSPLIPP